MTCGIIRQALVETGLADSMIAAIGVGTVGFSVIVIISGVIAGLHAV